MRIFFLSEKPCVLRVNGLWLGRVDGFERSAELDPKDAPFCEFCLPGFLPVRFALGENLLLDPPPQVRIYLTRRGTAVYVTGFVREDPMRREIASASLGGTAVSVFLEGRFYVTLSNETGTHTAELNDAFERASVSMAGELYLIEGENAFALLGRDGTLLTLSDGTVSEIGPRVLAEVPFHDCLGTTAVCEYEGGKLTGCRIRTRSHPAPATYALALFESVLLGANPAPYLAPALAEKAGALREYLGPFCDVVLTDRTDEVGLVYPLSPRRYEVRCFSVTLSEDGKVQNIAPSVQKKPEA